MELFNNQQSKNRKKKNFLYQNLKIFTPQKQVLNVMTVKTFKSCMKNQREQRKKRLKKDWFEKERWKNKEENSSFKMNLRRWDKKLNSERNDLNRRKILTIIFKDFLHNMKRHLSSILFLNFLLKIQSIQPRIPSLNSI